MSRPLARVAALLAVGATVLALTACTEDDDLYAAQGGGTASAPADAPEPAAEDEPAAAAVEGDPLVFPDFPGPELYGCETVVDETYNETAANVQWRWEFECRSPEPFEKTVASMNGHSAFEHPVDRPAEEPSYRSDNHHYIASINGNVWDVDLTAKGRPDKLKVTYIVTRAPE